MAEESAAQQHAFADAEATDNQQEQEQLLPQEDTKDTTESSRAENEDSSIVEVEQDSPEITPGKNTSGSLCYKLCGCDPFGQYEVNCEERCCGRKCAYATYVLFPLFCLIGLLLVFGVIRCSGTVTRDHNPSYDGPQPYNTCVWVGMLFLELGFALMIGFICCGVAEACGGTPPRPDAGSRRAE